MGSPPEPQPEPQPPPESQGLVGPLGQSHGHHRSRKSHRPPEFACRERGNPNKHQTPINPKPSTKPCAKQEGPQEERQEERQKQGQDQQSPARAGKEHPRASPKPDP